MSTHGFFSFVFFFFGCLGAIAQTPEEGAQHLATQLCACVNDSYKDIQPNVQQALTQLLRHQLDQQPKELERYVNSLPRTTLRALNRQIDVLQERGALSKGCLADLESTMRNMDTSDDSYEGLTGPAFNQLILKALQEKEQGELSAALWELGLRSQPSNASEQVSIGRVRNTTQ